jgi:hypothetical protein
LPLHLCRVDGALASVGGCALPGYFAGGIFAALALALVPTPAEAQSAAAAPRVRSDSPRVVDAIARGTRSSATFRRLLETIETTDGLVYIVEGRCARGVRACLLLKVTAAGPNRVLRIVVNVQRAPGCELVEAIGHELRHALEVLEDVRIRTDPQVYNFFDLVGRTSQDRFETEPALQAGLAIAAEGCGDP